MRKLDYQKLEADLIDFLRREVEKAGFDSVVFGLSGGIDSAVVAVLCKKAFDKNCRAVMMPSDTTNPIHMSHALMMCEKFDIEAEHVSIKNMLLAYPLALTPLRKGNLSARLRMSVLYDISNRDRALVVGTSNKSEIILGYGTMYGDTACAINPIGQLYKTQIFEFARHLGVIDEIINKAPSADLWEGQTDEDELGYTYAELDKVMFALFDNNMSADDVKNLGHSQEIIQTVQNRYKANTFKGKTPTIANVE